MPRRYLTACVTLAFVAVFQLSAVANPFGRAVIVNTAFTVKAGDAKYWNFRVGSDGANVVGRFRAEGGSGNDIKCLILDADSFENWRNGHRVRTYSTPKRSPSPTSTLPCPKVSTCLCLITLFRVFQIKQ
jgi:hypothetical protein